MIGVASSTGTEDRSRERSPRHQLQAAIQQLESATADASRRIALAEACFRLAVQPETDIDEAIELLQKAEGHDSCHPKIPFHLGRLRHKNGDPQGAILEYRRALRLAPRSHRTFVHLALALAELPDQKPDLATEIFAALVAGDDDRLVGLTEQLDKMIEAVLGSSKHPRQRSQNAMEAPPRGDAAAGGMRCRWKGLWKLLLLHEMAKPTPQKKRVSQFFDSGRTLVEEHHGASEYALACLFLLCDSPAAYRVVQERLGEAKLAGRLQRPALRLLEAACELAQAENAAAFVHLATAKVRSCEVPVELVCCLHYAWYGTALTLDAVEATRLVDLYPEEMQTHPCLREMRIAILDHHARNAWASGRFDRAEILWQETINLDPFRIAVAHNLALVATQTKARDKYELAWERATELRYLQAAAAADVRIELDDRARLHRSFAQQCQLRYAGTPDSRRGSEPPQENLAAWMADGEALTTWLREWELYYLNARIRFHSSVHLLGVAHDCADQDADAARDILRLQFELACGPRRWAGKQVFLHLVEQLSSHACHQAKDPIARRRDPYYKPEQAEADKLARDAIERGLLLLRMLRVAVDTDSPDIRLAGYRVARSLLLMPWRLLESTCRNAGLVSADESMVEVCLSHFLAVVARDLETEDVPRHVVVKATVFADCARALPASVDVRLWHCRFLLQAKRNRQAYDAALEALPLTDRLADRETAARQQQELVTCVDNAALGEMRPDVLRPSSREKLAETIAEGRRVLSEFPRAGRLRILVAECLIQFADTDAGTLADAAALVEAGMELVLSDGQLQEFRRVIEKAGSRSRSAEAVGRIRTLFESASKRAREAVGIVGTDCSPADRRLAIEQLGEAIHEVEQAEATATESGLPSWAEKARQQAADLRQILQGFAQE